MHSCAKVSIGFGVIALAVLIIVLIAVSVVDVENDEVGLIYHTVYREFDQNQVPLQQGRYAVQPGQKIFKFPRTYVLLSFVDDDSIYCLTNDGLVLSLEITFQYRIRIDQLVTMFLLLGEDYESVLLLQASASIQDVCGNYTSNEFYYARQSVQNAMALRVDQTLDNMYLDGGFLQLVNILFSDQFNNAIQSTQAAIQDVNSATSERLQQLVQAQTQELQAQQSAGIIITQAKANAGISLANGRAAANIVNVTLASQLQAYSGISDALGLPGQSIINYIAIAAIENAQTATVRVDAPAKFGVT